MFHISSDDLDEQKSKSYIAVCLKKVCEFQRQLSATCTLWVLDYVLSCVLPQGCSDTAGFMHAVFGLLLPLGYEYNPDLVVVVRMLDSNVCDALWQQLTGLLQSFATGHTLVLMQVRRPGLFCLELVFRKCLLSV